MGRENEPTVLAYDNPVFRVHEPIIAELEDQAWELGVLRRSFCDDILTRTGLVCDRPRGDRSPSVSGTYFGVMKRAVEQEMAANGDLAAIAHAAEQRVLMQSVLAAHMSIMECDPANPPDREQLPYEAYVEVIEDLEQWCRTHGVPSLLPNLFQPASLFQRLQDPAYRIDTKPEMTEFYQQMLLLFGRQDKHVHVIITTLQRQGAGAQAIKLLEGLADNESVELAVFFKRNPLLAATYIEALFDSARYTDVIVATEALPTDVLTRTPDIGEKYLRALIALERFEDAMACIELYDISNGRDQLKARGIACEKIGQWLQSQHRYQEGVAFLEKHAAYEIRSSGRGSRTNMQMLYLTLSEGMEAEERAKA